MSLAEAVKDCVDRMESVCGSCDTISTELVKGHLRELRLVLKACSDRLLPDSKYTSSFSLGKNKSQAALERIAAVEEAARVQREISAVEEKHYPKMAEFVGGKSDGVVAPMDDTAPVGAKTVMDMEVYEKQPDGVWRYSEEATIKWLASK